MNSDSGHAALFIETPDGLLPMGAKQWQCYDLETQAWAAALVTATAPTGNALPEAEPPSTAPEPEPAPVQPGAP